MRSPRRASRPGIALLGALLLLQVGACGPWADDGRSDAGGPAQVARSAAGMVVAAQPLATRAGVRMLEQGGNAADAAVAAAFALTVVEPSMNGLGGRTQVLVRTAAGELHGIDATTQAPASYDPDTAERASYGYPTVGVPGTVAGLTKLLRDHGTLPLRTVMAPAIEHASEGFRLLPGEAERHARGADRLAEFEGSRTYFLKGDGTPYRAGELFVQEELSRTLRAIAVGGEEAFYRGRIADRIVQDMEARGGHVTRESLAAYRAEDAVVVGGSYRGFGVAGNWIPSFGAITIEILHILETFDLEPLSEVQWGGVVGQAVRAAYRDRDEQDSLDDAERLISREWARQRAGDVVVPGLGRVQEPVGARAPRRTDEVARPGPAPAARSLPRAWSADPGHTTHLSTADSSGMTVALTQTIGPSLGSGVAAPGLGFLYAATLGGYLGRMEPGERAASHISPIQVFRRGEPAFVLGAAGGSRIPSAVIQVLSRTLDRGMSFAEAVAAPRVHPAGDTLLVEASGSPGWTPARIEALRAAGFPARPVQRQAAFGRIHGIRYHSDTGEWEGVADPDWEGSAAAPRGPGSR